MKQPCCGASLTLFLSSDGRGGHRRMKHRDNKGESIGRPGVGELGSRWCVCRIQNIEYRIQNTDIRTPYYACRVSSHPAVNLGNPVSLLIYSITVWPKRIQTHFISGALFVWVEKRCKRHNAVSAHNSADRQTHMLLSSDVRQLFVPLGDVCLPVYCVYHFQGLVNLQAVVTPNWSRIAHDRKYVFPL